MNSLINDSRTVAETLSDALEANPQIMQKTIAEAAGLGRPNNIYNFKHGKSKIPLDKAGKVAEAVHLDPREFWLKCLKEYMPAAYAEFERYCKQPILSASEIKFIRAARSKDLNLMSILEEQVNKEINQQQ